MSDFDSWNKDSDPASGTNPEQAPEFIPNQEENPVTEMNPVTEPIPATEPTPVTEPMPATEPMPVTEPMPATEPAPIAEPTPIIGSAPESQAAFSEAQAAPTMEAAASSFGQPSYEIPSVQEPFTYERQPEPAQSNPALAIRKKAPAWLFVLAGTFVALIALVLAFVFVPTLSNAFSLATMSPAKYYAKVELRNFSKNIDSFTEFYGESLKPAKADTAPLKPAGIKLSMKAIFDPAFLSALGLPDTVDLKTAGMNVTGFGDLDKGKIKLDYDFLFNDKALTSLNGFFDPAAMDYTFQIKDLSDAYIKVGMEEYLNQIAGSNIFSGIASQNIEQQPSAEDMANFPLTEDILNLLLKRYSKTIIAEIKTVSLEKKQKLEIGKVSGKSTKITVSLTPDELLDILAAVLDEAAEDKELLDMVVQIGQVTEAEYDAGISLLKVALQSLKNQASSGFTIDMIVWVNKKGEVTAREFNFKQDGSLAALGYGHLTDGPADSFHFFVGDGTMDIIKMEGTSSSSKTGHNGDLKLFISDGTSTDNVDFTITYENVKKADEKGHFEGSFKAISNLFPGYALTMAASSGDNFQSLLLDCLENNAKTVTLDIKMENIPYEDFELPAGGTVYEYEDIDQYSADADIEGFIKHLEDVTGIDMSSLFVDGYTDAEPALPGLPKEEADAPAKKNNTPEEGNAQQSANLPDGVTVDENGYYTYEPDYDTIMAAGLAGNGYVTFPVKASAAEAQVDALAKELLGANVTKSEPSVYNQVMGNTDPAYGYESSYYQTSVYWSSEDYNSSIYFIYDTVTNDVIELQVEFKDAETTKNALLSCIEIVKGTVPEKDKASILESLVPKEEDGYAFTTYDDNVSLYISQGDNYCNGRVSAE